MGREIQRFNQETKEWDRIHFSRLIKNDIFKIYDDNERYSNPDTDDNVWIASSDAYLHNDIYTIDTVY